MTDRDLPRTLLTANARWAEGVARDDAGYFDRLAAGQQPAVLWIGCSDSRVPPTDITGLGPGDVFVHRNIAGLVTPGDPSVGAVVQYAVGVLEVDHVVVCGHEGCGGVAAAVGSDPLDDPLAGWLAPIRAVADQVAEELAEVDDEATRLVRLVERNVQRQVANLLDVPVVRERVDAGGLEVHAWVFSLASGRLRDVSDRVAAGTSAVAPPR